MDFIGCKVRSNSQDRMCEKVRYVTYVTTWTQTRTTHGVHQGTDPYRGSADSAARLIVFQYMKNTTHLKRHLRTHHPAVSAKVNMNFVC